MSGTLLCLMLDRLEFSRRPVLEFEDEWMDLVLAKLSCVLATELVSLALPLPRA